VREDEFQRAVLHLAKLHHLHVAHFRAAMTGKGRWVTPVGADGKGYPDLTAVGPGGVIWRELKTDTGRLSEEQKLWIRRLVEAGADVAVWRPRDLADGTIAATLARIAKPRAEVAS
jgi:hypothetical protein